MFHERLRQLRASFISNHRRVMSAIGVTADIAPIISKTGWSYGHYPTDQPFSVAGQELPLRLIGIADQVPFYRPHFLDLPAFRPQNSTLA